MGNQDPPNPPHPCHRVQRVGLVSQTLRSQAGLLRICLEVSPQGDVSSLPNHCSLFLKTQNKTIFGFISCQAIHTSLLPRFHGWRKCMWGRGSQSRSGDSSFAPGAWSSPSAYSPRALRKANSGCFLSFCVKDPHTYPNSLT